MMGLSQRVKKYCVPRGRIPAADSYRYGVIVWAAGRRSRITGGLADPPDDWPAAPPP